MLRKTFVVALLAAIALPLMASATTYTETWRYYPEGDFDITMVWNLPVFDDYYVQGFDPADFDTGDADYKIVQIGINTYHATETGNGPLALHIMYLPTKDSSPDGVSYEYDLTGQTLDWAAGVTTLNTYDVDWDVPGGQCIGLTVIGEDPYFDDYVITMDNEPADTSNWEHMNYPPTYPEGWYHVKDDLGYDQDFAFEITVEYGVTTINPASLGEIKAGFH